MAYNMSRQLEIGAEGASRVKLLLARKFGELVDYEGVKEKQKRGIDILIQPFGFVEIKTDTHVTENFFFEYECSGKPSGLMTSEADWWAYYFVELGRIYMLPLVQLRDYVEKNKKWFVSKYRKVIQSYAGDSLWEASGLVIPRDYVCGEIDVKIYEDYKDRLWLVAGKEKEIEERARTTGANKTAATDKALSEIA